MTGFVTGFVTVFRVSAKKQFSNKLVRNHFSVLFWNFEPSRWGSDPRLGWLTGSGASSGPAWHVCSRGDWRRCSSATAPPPACPIIGHVVITLGDLFDSPIPNHSVPATATPHVGERKGGQGSALLLVTAREQFKVGDTPQLLRFRLRVGVSTSI